VERVRHRARGDRAYVGNREVEKGRSDKESPLRGGQVEWHTKINDPYRKLKEGEGRKIP